MSLVEAYIFRTAFLAFVAGLAALTGIIWISQSLHQFDLMTTQRQTLIIFLAVTSLTIPSLVMIIAPVALFIGTLYALNKLNGDSELVVMSAAGLSPSRLLRPFAVLIVIVTLIVGTMSLWIMPWTFRELRVLVTQIRADFLTHIVHEGEFATLDAGFVFHYRERGPNGALLGIFMQDRRDPDQVSTYLAETGMTAQSGDQSFLVLEKGSVQRQTKGERDPAIVVFQRYALDLSQFGNAGEHEALKPRERSTRDLLTADPQDPYVARNMGAFRAELNDRLVSPLYAAMFGMIAFAALGQPRTTRQGRGMAIAVAVIIVLTLRIAGFGASALLTKHVWAIGLDYLIPIGGMVGAAFCTFQAPLISKLFSKISSVFVPPSVLRRRRA
ncbi:MAG TPA: LPS export ABC transporter permease LptF [Beijerinckiaceae bacterium]|nr:LPS export ABC transporter permease LptF [Beijerinckiaceae bacterium]